MSRTIRIADTTYDRLERFRAKRETFSEAVDRLLKIRETIGELQDIIEGQIAFREGQHDELRQATPVH